jgi:vitamin B12 transporter
MVSYAFTDKIKLNANYTFTELEKQSRILNPKHKVNASVDIAATSRLGLNVAYQFVSDRVTQYTIYNPGPTIVNEILKDYQLVNTNVRYTLIKDKLNTFLAVDNVLNKDFVEARGYSTRGRNFKIGFNFLF